MNTECEMIKIPVLPLRDVVVYPYMVISLFVGREKSISCIKIAMKNDKKIILVTQKEASTDEPSINDIFSVGTISYILQMLKLPDGTIKILVEGIKRVRILQLADTEKYLIAESYSVDNTDKINKKEKIFLIRTIINQFEYYIQLNKKIPREILISLNHIDNASRIADTIAAYIPLKLKDKQTILGIENLTERLEYLIAIIESEIEFFKIEHRIKNRVKNQMEKTHREYYLNEQIKAIQKELGENLSSNENAKLKRQIENTKMPIEAKEKTKLELKKLKMMSPMSAEATVIRSYIEWMLLMPWKIRSKIKKNILKAKYSLDQDHYGLKKIKERILEYLAVQSRKKKIKGQILCLVGPPGVGKTSLGKSIAKATGRKYIRMALGGVRDEAEIRGHRRTYVGSMPGKIIQKISKIGVNNPLFLLDEIDKISSDMRGDPASALLEVLDSEQNANFNDHYLEVDFDLSDVMFVATSNSINIPTPLLDRMEVINISGYTEDEKLNIACNHIIPKQIKINALKNHELKIENNALLNIIRYYTREAGVRNLEREISKICRKSVKFILMNKTTKKIIINIHNLKKFIGKKKFDYGITENKNKIGQSTGLAWTEYGGDLLTIETACVPGKGNLIYTGSLGEVMQESIQAALTVVRSRASKLGINTYFYEKSDIHVHVPEGATPKDGPSAGIAICTSLVSSLTTNPVKSNIAMTGEITLRGKILIIGGLKEKLLAAHRGGIKIVIIPYNNKRDLEDIPYKVKNEIKIYPIKTIEDVLKLTLQNNPFKN